MSKRDKTDLYFWIFVAVLLAFLGAFFAFLAWGVHAACDKVCEANGDRSHFVRFDGCYCEDDWGLYNPKKRQ